MTDDPAAMKAHLVSRRLGDQLPLEAVRAAILAKQSLDSDI